MLDRARTIAEQLVAWRREFHTFPELGFQETRTAGRVAEELAALGYRLRTGVGVTGVVGERGEGHPIVAVRADMDALPIQEENAVPYASQIPGVMHACGHDAHTAMGLGVATLLAQETFPGTLRLLFQPAEEVNGEDGRSGAFHMASDGAMEGVDAVLALHVDSLSPCGHVEIESGPFSAGVDTFYLTITGEGVHGAMPYRGIDPIYISSCVIQALHGIVSRRLNPHDPAVISIGSIHGGQADNVIPERVEMSGTIRFMEPKVREQIHAEIERVAGVSRALGGDYELKIEFGALPIINDPKVVTVIRQVVLDLLGPDHFLPLTKEMGSEDFSEFTALAPGAMFSLGSQIAGEERQAHGPTFDVNEDCLPVGAAILAETALRLLRQGDAPTDA